MRHIGKYSFVGVMKWVVGAVADALKVASLVCQEERQVINFRI